MRIRQATGQIDNGQTQILWSLYKLVTLKKKKKKKKIREVNCCCMTRIQQGPAKALNFQKEVTAQTQCGLSHLLAEAR